MRTRGGVQERELDFGLGKRRVSENFSFTLKKSVSMIVRASRSIVKLISGFPVSTDAKRCVLTLTGSLMAGQPVLLPATTIRLFWKKR